MGQAFNSIEDKSLKMNISDSRNKISIHSDLDISLQMNWDDKINNWQYKVRNN